MLRSYFLLNVILIALAGFLSLKFYESLSKPLSLPPNAVQKQMQSNAPDKKEPEKPEAKKDTVDSHILIVQKDLFRPSRTAPKPEEISKLSIPPTPPPKLIGITVMGNENKAFMEDPITKTAKAYRIKESIAGFTVQEIQEDRVILLRGEERVEIDIRKIKTIESPGKIPPAIPAISPKAPVEAAQPVQPSVQPPQNIQPTKNTQPPHRPVYISPKAVVPLPFQEKK